MYVELTTRYSGFEDCSCMDTNKVHTGSPWGISSQVIVVAPRVFISVAIFM